MSVVAQSTIRNHILSRLSAADPNRMAFYLTCGGLAALSGLVAVGVLAAVAALKPSLPPGAVVGLSGGIDSSVVTTFMATGSPPSATPSTLRVVVSI